MVTDAGGGAGAPAGWYPDPHRRYDQRYYDGSAWTSHVSTRAGTSTDVVPDSLAEAAPIPSAPLAGPPSPTGVGPLAGALPPQVTPTAAAMYAPSTMPGGGMGPSAYREPTRMVGRNGIGLGFVLACLGWATVLGSSQLAWIDGQAAFALSSTSGDVGGMSYTSQFQFQLAISIAFLIVVILATTLRYQPGKLVGFLYGGCIGLIVCWSPLDRDSRSARSNVLGFFVVAVYAFSLWYYFSLIGDHVPRYQGSDTGPGLPVFLAGMAVLAVGVGIGRRYRRTEV